MNPFSLFMFALLAWAMVLGRPRAALVFLLLVGLSETVGRSL